MASEDSDLPVPRRPARDDRVVQRGFWRKLRRTLGLIPFSDDLLAAYYCAIDPVTPNAVKAMLMAAIAYFVVPTDLVPDFIAGFGFTDDASVLALTIAAVSSHIKPQHQAQAKDYLEKTPADGPDN